MHSCDTFLVSRVPSLMLIKLHGPPLKFWNGTRWLRNRRSTTDTQACVVSSTDKTQEHFLTVETVTSTSFLDYIPEERVYYRAISHYLCQYISETSRDNMNSYRPISETISIVSSNIACRLLVINPAYTSLYEYLQNCRQKLTVS